MKEKIFEFIPDEKKCSYLGDKKSLFRYLKIENCSNDLYQALLERGYRRFGEYFFVPICAGCMECITIRQHIQTYAFTRSNQRIMKKNGDVKVTIQRPSVTDTHLRLYEKYHLFMKEKKGWEFSGISGELYYDMFVEGFCEFGYELIYSLGDRVVAIALVDMLPSSISAVYCFYDPEMQDRSLGKFSILKQLEIGKRLGMRHFYPGYWIEGHYAMGYKSDFKPFEILLGRPGLHEQPIYINHTYRKGDY